MMRYIQSYRLRALGVIALVFVLACGSDHSQVITQSEKLYHQGYVSEAAGLIKEEAYSSGKSQLLYLMEAGMMLHTAEDYDNSIKVMMRAARMADQVPISVSKQAASLFLNEKVTNYRGEDFERVLTHMYLGINFLMMKEPDEARVEFKEVNIQLTRINNESGKKYNQNVMAKYLTAVSYEMIGDMDRDEEAWEFAYIEYKQVAKLRPDLAMVYADLQRLAKKLGYEDDYQDLVAQYGQREKAPEGSGELVVIYQAGLSAVKASRGKLLSDQAMARSIDVALRNMPLEAGVTTTMVMAALNKAENPIPKYEKRSNKVASLRIVLNNTNLGKTIEMEDIENTAVRTMEDDYGRLRAKVAAGIVTKIATSLAVGLATQKVAEQSDNQYISALSGLMGAAAGGATGAALASQIKPDLRCWHSLPANLQLGRWFVEPGTYTVTLQFLNNYGQVTRTETDEVEIVSGERAFLNYRTLY